MTKQLNEEKRTKIMILLEEGYSSRVVALKMKISQSTVIYTKKKYINFKTYKHIGGNGRPSIQNEFILAKIKHLINENNRLSLRKIVGEIKKENKIEISHMTVKRILNNMNLFAYSPLKKPLLSKKNIICRFDCSKIWIKMNEDDIKRIMFTDESKFNLFYSDGKKSVWRKKGEGLEDKNLEHTVKHGGGSILVWGSFSYYGVGELYIIRDIMDAVEYVNILSTSLFKSAKKMGLKSFIFQFDKDPKHTSKLAREYISENKIETLCWPAQSPDCNPIENLWALIKVEIAIKRPKKIKELEEIIINTWNNIPVELTKKLALSFKNRAKEVYRKNGKHINY
jgi:transposase